MANAALYFHDGLRPQPLPVHKSLSGVRIHREVPDLKRRKILEEMAALRWRHAQVTQSRLYDHPGSGDLIPCNWDSEPRVVRPPTTNPDEQIWCAVLAQPPIEVGSLLFLEPLFLRTCRSRAVRPYSRNSEFHSPNRPVPVQRPI